MPTSIVISLFWVAVYSLSVCGYAACTWILLGDTTDTVNACGGLWWWCLVSSVTFILRVMFIVVHYPTMPVHLHKLDAAVPSVIFVWGLIITTELLPRTVSWNNQSDTCHTFYEQNASSLLVYYKAVLWILATCLALAITYQPFELVLV